MPATNRMNPTPAVQRITVLFFVMLWTYTCQRRTTTVNTSAVRVINSQESLSESFEVPFPWRHCVLATTLDRRKLQTLYLILQQYELLAHVSFAKCGWNSFIIRRFANWRIRDQLDVPSYHVLFHFFYAQHVSDINTSFIRSLRLFYCITTLVVCSCFDVCWSFGVAVLGWYPCGCVGMVSV